MLNWIAIATVVLAAFTIGCEIGWYRGEDFGRKMERLRDAAHTHLKGKST